MTSSAFDYVEYNSDLERINGLAERDPADFIIRTEHAYQRNIDTIAARIAHAESPCKVIMLAGPSSSGKTTTAHMLADAFREFYVHAEIISLDDFYKGEENAPLLPDGQRDYESVNALDIAQIQRCLLSLMQKNECDMPVFDFTTHTPYPYTRHLNLKPRDIAIVEGIHALNPVISQPLPRDGLLKAYISVKQGVTDANGKELISANDMRLIRRLVRDSKFRCSPPERTLRMWPNVMDGEYKYIKPFRENADITINSLHLYEPCVLRKDAIPLLRAVEGQGELRDQANSLLRALECFQPITEGLVPLSSMMREFIGGGQYS